MIKPSLLYRRVLWTKWTPLAFKTCLWRWIGLDASETILFWPLICFISMSYCWRKSSQCCCHRGKFGWDCKKTTDLWSIFNINKLPRGYTSHFCQLPRKIRYLWSPCYSSSLLHPTDAICVLLALALSLHQIETHQQSSWIAAIPRSVDYGAITSSGLRSQKVRFFSSYHRNRGFYQIWTWSCDFGHHLTGCR